MQSDIEIAQAASLAPIPDVAASIGIPAGALIPYGHDKAKLSATFLRSLAERETGKLVLVTAMSPTPAGEGKTTTTIGLADALRRIGRKVVIALREPSMGPCFGQKGGATGGGWAQVAPMVDINLHFTGDFHAISAAANLLAAMVDNHLYWKKSPTLDPRRIAWRRVVDMNDRSLRRIVSSLGNGVPQESGFDITVASEVMAILCLAADLTDLQARLGRIVVGYDHDGAMVTAADLKADGAMTALLKDAVLPNLVQTLEGTPALVHGGPFANIAHGCNSVIATRTALALGDVVVTEAGFGADLGAEKFFDIKCRGAGLAPSAAVVVATVRSLKMHGGVGRADLAHENVEALEAGFANLRRHLENLKGFGLPVVVAVNEFTSDTPAEIARLQALCEAHGARAILCRHWADGGAGAVELAHAVAQMIDAGEARFVPLYAAETPLKAKIETIAQRIYGAASVSYDPAASTRLARWQRQGFGHLPVCMAKTPYSFSTDMTLLGAPEGHDVHVREVRLSAGAGFVVATCGEILTMPGLPRHPAAEGIGVDAEGRVVGLF
ncbi:MAG TPA: formate--tetrahydrofolate ligase [Caulobacteraceae bacterium]|jgi:formate--tetrahydrofolate ligase|nr:formate--tetrahydrofolate ligase [Caulobacteraceae bacterium]